VRSTIVDWRMAFGLEILAEILNKLNKTLHTMHFFNLFPKPETQEISLVLSLALGQNIFLIKILIKPNQNL
jgi:hypothetical protein